MPKMLKLLITILLSAMCIGRSRSSCDVQVVPNEPNRTMCILPQISEEVPLDFEIKNPPYLYLTVNKGEIPESTFKNVKPTNELWFIGNNITYIHPGAFQNLSSLKSLAITNTSIQKLSKGTFVGLSNLQTLALNNNHIKYIEDGAFSGLENLDQLILDDNNITKLNEKTFDGLKFLKGLFLNNNPIEYIHDSSLQNIKDLTHLNISIKQGKNVSENAFLLPRLFQLRVFYLTD